MAIKRFLLPLPKIGIASAIQASLIAFGSHYFCIKQAAPQQFKRSLTAFGLRCFCIR